MALTPRQQAFVDAFDGSRSQAEVAAAAGYRGDQRTLEVTASRLMKNAEVRAAILARGLRTQQIPTTPAEAVLSREGRQRWWARVMGDEGYELKDRLKASELLGRSDGDFIDRTELSLSATTLEALVLEARKPR